MPFGISVAFLFVPHCAEHQVYTVGCKGCDVDAAWVLPGDVAWVRPGRDTAKVDDSQPGEKPVKEGVSDE